MDKFIVGVPFSGCEKHIGKDYIVATREDEAMAMAVGAELTGKKSLVFMQNSGLGNCVDVLTSLCKPYGVEPELIISNRSKPKHHLWMWKITRGLLKALKYDTYRLC